MRLAFIVGVGLSLMLSLIVCQWDIAKIEALRCCSEYAKETEFIIQIPIDTSNPGLSKIKTNKALFQAKG